MKTSRSALDGGSTKSLALPIILQRFLKQSALWTLLCVAVEAFCRWALHAGYPYSYPAVLRALMFGDFSFWISNFTNFHSAAFFNPSHRLMYPAPIAVSYKLFLLAGGIMHPHFATLRFVGIIIATYSIATFLVCRALTRRGLAPRSAILFSVITSLLSFPLFFELHQANMEFMVWAIMSLGLWAFWTAKPNAAAVFFGIAAAMKFFPVVFLGLFIARRQYRQVALTLLATAATTVVSLWIVCPDIAYSFQQTSLGVDQFRKTYMLGLLPMESGFDHSSFCLFKRLLPSLPGPARMGRLLSVYLVVAALGGVFVFFARIRKLPVVNQVLCLSVAAILLPPTSFDYTLLHLYAPFVLLVFVVLKHCANGPDIAPPPGIPLALGLLAFILSAQSEFIHNGLRYAGQLKAVALLALFAIGLSYPFQITNDQRSSEFEP